MKNINIASSDKRVKNRFKLSPKAVVTGVALCLGLLLIFGKEIKYYFADRFNPRISFQESGSQRKRETGQAKQQTQTVIFDGEVYRTETRLREASAVVIAASITGVASYMEHHPLQDVTGLLTGMMQRGLMPPGIELVKERNLLLSERSAIYLRFRPSPFAVEVVSLGRQKLDGPALILRVPDENKLANNLSINYFHSLTLEDVQIPDPFSSPTSILACGWQSATLKPELLEGVNIEKLDMWAGEKR